MKTIYLVRHAKSSWDDSSLPDMVRPLNERGRDTSLWMGRYLYTSGVRPALMVSSPATRALHTALNLSVGLRYKPEKILTDTRLYFEGQQKMLTVLKQLPDNKETVMVIGHDPDISLLAELLTGEQIEKFPTCSVFVVTASVKGWRSLKAGSGRKQAFLLAKELMQANPDKAK